jgi:predicted nucleotidyltransferase
MSNPVIANLPERVRDRDIFRDYQNRLFVTLGYIQPKDRILSFLKYVPDSSGKWIAEGVRYKRHFWGSVDSTTEGMTLLPDDYIIMDSHFQTDLVEPPRDKIQDYFRPEMRLQEILSEPQDDLEELVRKAAHLIHDELGLSVDCLGISGSILWKGHNPSFSDINMNVYGFKDSWQLCENYTALEQKDIGSRVRNITEWDRAIERVRSRIPILEVNEFQKLFQRRKALCFGERCIGITSILNPDETPITHGSETYATIVPDPVRISSAIANTDYGIFHPAIYEITPTEINQVIVTRIMIYDGAFGGLFLEGDHVEVSGTLQKVSKKDSGEPTHQLMVGTKSGSGREYVRRLS